MKYCLLIGFFFLSSFIALGQKKGKVEIIADSRVADLVDTHVLFNQKTQTIPGFRIRIFARSGNNSKTEAFSVKDKFTTNYPGVEAYWTFEEPNFKVKVGDFKTRLEAFAFLQKIKNVYPESFIIRDNVYTYKLKSSDLIEEDADLENP